MSEAALYRHFADKEALLTAVVLDNLPQLGGGLRGAQGLPLEDALRQVALGGLAYMLDLGALFLSMWADPELTRKVLKSVRNRGAAPVTFIQMFGEWIGGLPELEGTSDAFRDVVAYMLFGALGQYAWMARITEDGELPSPEQFTAVLAAGLVDMIEGRSGRLAP